jgi:predicted phage terminase large subunit-like protein
VTDVNGYNSMRDMPAKETMRFYAASDHAVSQAQAADKTCLMCVGVDQADHIWVMPDLVWARLDSHAAVEGMVAMMERYKPQFWWAEAGAIGKSIGPFLRKRMLEKRVFCAIDPIPPVADKQQRAQSIQARSAMKMVHFPTWTRWWAEAQDQLLKFPNAQHDDFVDTLALIGLGLSKMRPRQRQVKKEPPKTGTYGEMIEETKRREGVLERKRSLDGWL